MSYTITRPNDYFKTENFCELLKSISTCLAYPVWVFSTTIDCAISLQRYAGFFEFLLLSWRNVKHLVTLSLGLSWHNEIIWLLLLKNNIGCQYSIAKSSSLCSGNKFCTITQRRCKVHCMVPVTIRSPIYLNYNAFTSIYTQFQLYFLSDYINYACFIWSPKEWICWSCPRQWRNITWHKKTKIGLIKLPQIELSNDV